MVLLMQLPGAKHGLLGHLFQSLSSARGVSRCSRKQTHLYPRTSKGSRSTSSPVVGPAPAGTAEALGVEEPPAFERLMQHARLTHIAHELWQQVCRPGDVVVDATCGNGHDTLCLARAVGASGTVVAFDVQESAISATRALLHISLPAEERPALHILKQSHDRMQEVVGSGTARAVVFNLGYLPGSDKAVTTQAGSTAAAVRAACQVLRPGGLLSLLCYTSHEGGMNEYEVVKEVVSGLPTSAWVSSQVQLLNRPTAPILLLAWKQPQRREGSV